MLPASSEIALNNAAQKMNDTVTLRIAFLIDTALSWDKASQQQVDF
jgi:hypothetical protein